MDCLECDVLPAGIRENLCHSPKRRKPGFIPPAFFPHFPFRGASIGDRLQDDGALSGLSTLSAQSATAINSSTNAAAPPPYSSHTPDTSTTPP
jgi:hypothetical protein